MKRRKIEWLLPELFRRTVVSGNPISALLDIMEALHAPPEGILGDLDRIFDPHRTADDFVPFLACWLDLDRFFGKWVLAPLAGEHQEAITTGTGRLRELVARAAYLSKWRGTAKGLIAFLETATGVKGFGVREQIQDEEGKSQPFHMEVEVPGELEPHFALIDRIIESEKPAYVTYQIVLLPIGV
jgi:phage tail-like protein